ncbi:MAG: hypothetical protein JST43_04675 [Bacteroidetes bacterium]|nr:hypothetical protein [Bacteroidota bacterium]MBS1539882.1 hypothetical protein [Bacteroidota bacterium]
MKYELNNQPIHYFPEGEKKFGQPDVLLHRASDLTVSTRWSAKGYTIAPLFDTETFTTFQSETTALVTDCWRQAGLLVPDHFKLDQYHTLITTQAQHLAAVEQTKLLSAKKFPLGISRIEERVSDICGISLIALNPFDGQSVFHFRVVRPHSHDNNPLHRDVWLEDYANCINLYIPVAGSNALSSLPLIPGSHYWPEDKIERTENGALINNTKFNVPAVSEIHGEFQIVRPDPVANEVLVFSPYLIHGGAVNLNDNLTRISIELRLWKKN